MIMSSVAAFWVVSLMFVITPGADWAYAITAGMREGASQPAIAGLLLGHLTATMVVAAGVGVLVANTPVALTALTVLGSAYLLWLGFNMVANPPVPTAGEGAAAGSWTRWVVKGFGVSGLNPKVFLLFLALLPQFTNPAAVWPIPMQMILLGTVHVINCGVIYALVAAGSQSVLRTRPRAARTVGQISGAVMIALAALLLAEQFFG
jgi:threonine/homoserine/homoserine lactone efflux protein